MVAAVVVVVVVNHYLVTITLNSNDDSLQLLPLSNMYTGTVIIFCLFVYLCVHSHHRNHHLLTLRQTRFLQCVGGGDQEKVHTNE